MNDQDQTTDVDTQDMLDDGMKPATAPTGPIRFTLGEVMLVQGLHMKLTYVNPGRKRLTFTVLDDVRLIDPVEKDPIVGVSRR